EPSAHWQPRSCRSRFGRIARRTAGVAAPRGQVGAMERHDGTSSVTPDLATALAELANLMMATPTTSGLLDDLCHLAVEVLTPSVSCGITMGQDHLPLTRPAATRLPRAWTRSSTATIKGRACKPCAPG